MDRVQKIAASLAVKLTKAELSELCELLATHERELRDALSDELRDAQMSQSRKMLSAK